MKYLATGLFVSAILLLATALKGKPTKQSRQHGTPVKTSAARIQTADTIADGIAKAGNVDKAQQQYDRRIASVQYSHNMAAVAHTCLEKYHRDSCIHHLIKCGPKCKVLIPEQKFAFIESQYWELMRERGLEQDK